MNKIGALLFFVFIVSVAFSQPQCYGEDSLKANAIISHKIKEIKCAGVTRFLYLYSDAGSLAIIYEKNGLVKVEKASYKGKRGAKFRKVKASGEEILSFYGCVDLAKHGKEASLSNCEKSVHSFNRIVFAISTNGQLYQGNFTTDCSGVMENKNMKCLVSIYRSVFL